MSIRTFFATATLIPALVLVNSATAAETLDAFYIGHSLISDIPDMVRSLDRASTKSLEFTFREQFIPGAPLRWQWEDKDRNTEHEPAYRGAYHHHIPSGDYEILVATDSVPRGGKELVAESCDYLNRFAQFAWEANPNTRVYYYETWHCIDSGTPKGCDYDNASATRTLLWRERLVADRAMWLSLVEHVRKENPQAPRAYLIPAGTALVKLAEAIDRKELPGFTTEKDLFDDAIHLNAYGKYFVACVHYATLFGRSPVGLPIAITDRWGRSYWDTPTWDKKLWSPPDPTAIQRMQKIAWEVVSNDAESGVGVLGK